MIITFDIDKKKEKKCSIRANKTFICSFIKSK